MRLSERDVVASVEEVSLRHLRLWVRKGWVAPAAGTQGHVFREVDVARVRLVCELKQTLALNDDAVSVVLSLIDQVHGLRGRLRVLGHAIEQQPEGVRRRITDLVRRMDEDG